MRAAKPIRRPAGQILRSYGMWQIARFFLRDAAFVIELSDTLAADLPASIYVFVIDDEIVRVGCSAAPLKVRFGRWQGDVTAAMNGRRSSTPLSEAAKWKRRLEDFGEGKIFARQACEVTSAIGSFRAMLDEERVLIARHRPPMNSGRQ